MKLKTIMGAVAFAGFAVSMTANAWAAAAGKEIENPYGLQSMWAKSDMLSKFVLVVLVIMSLGTWYIGILKYLEQAKLFKQGKEVEGKSWKTETIVSDIQELKEESAFRFVAQSVTEAAINHDQSQIQRVDFVQWLDMSIVRATNLISGRLQGGLPFLASVGSTAPFVGLLGTVWGIYHALTEIGTSGQASIDKVAGPVGEALIMTAIGLAVAIPAVLGYNWLVRRNKVVMERVKHFGASLQMILLSDR